MTDDEYLEYMDKPLSEAEKQILTNAGWSFLNDEYIYIPDDYDGSMASGIRSIRRMLLGIQYPAIYSKHLRTKDILEEILNNRDIDVR